MNKNIWSVLVFPVIQDANKTSLGIYLKLICTIVSTSAASLHFMH